MGQKRWWGSELEKLRADYEGGTLLLVDVVKKHGTSMNMIARLQRKHCWKPRKATAPRPYNLHRNAEMGQMQARVIYLDKLIKDNTRERDHLSHKIAFLETLGRRPFTEDG